MFFTDFVNAARDLYFDVLSFTGDSMAIQLAQRLVCGVMRRNIKAVPSIFGDFFNYPPRGASAVIDTGHSLGQLMVSAQVITTDNYNISCFDKLMGLHCDYQIIHFLFFCMYEIIFLINIIISGAPMELGLAINHKN